MYWWKTPVLSAQRFTLLVYFIYQMFKPRCWAVRAVYHCERYCDLSHISLFFWSSWSWCPISTQFHSLPNAILPVSLILCSFHLCSQGIWTLGLLCLSALLLAASWRHFVAAPPPPAMSSSTVTSAKENLSYPSTSSSALWNERDIIFLIAPANSYPCV